MFYFIRHGEPDNTERGAKIYQGFGTQLAGLSETGVRQIQETAKDPRLAGADVILSSPYTRALQTAAILSKELGADIVVETDLHEWLADKAFTYVSDEAAGEARREYERNGGEYPEGKERAWESAPSMRARVLGVLERYSAYGKVVVACHGMAIQAAAGGRHPGFGEIVEFRL